MLLKVRCFIYFHLLKYITISATTNNEIETLENNFQTKDIHIIDVQGILGDLEINATYKDIKTLQIAGKHNENLLDLFEQPNIHLKTVLQSQKTKLAAQAAIIKELKAQICNLNNTILDLRNFVEESKAKTISCDNFKRVELINLPGIRSFPVLCDSCGTAGSGWIVIQRRFDGSVDFYRDWNAYRIGFGLNSGEFFIGLDKIYQLTNSRPYELYIELIDFQNSLHYARYDNFLIGSEQEKYMLKSLGIFSGTAGDSLKYSLFDKFSTYDNDNDGWAGGNNANFYGSGWWFNWNTNSNLNGRYTKTGERNVKGIWWYTMKGYCSLKSVKMLMKPKYTLV